MAVPFEYELWDGHKVVGKICLPYEVTGKGIAILEEFILKQRYSQKLKEIKIPIITVKTDYKTYRIMLDVRRKSPRQIALILA